jgi:hypothetical protein
MRKAIIPPMAAHKCPSGCSITTTVPWSVRSTQCCPLGTAPVSDSGRGFGHESLSTSLSVDAGPMVLDNVLEQLVHDEAGTYGTGRAVNIVPNGPKYGLTNVSEIPGTRYLSRDRLLQFQDGIRDLAEGMVNITVIVWQDA